MIRRAAVTDYPAFASLYRELGLDEAPPDLDRWRRDLVHGTLIAEGAGQIDGYVHFHTLGRVGYVRNLVVAARMRSAGRGMDLMLAAAAALRAAGVREWHLNVKDGNAPAIHLYEKLGLRAEHRSTAVRFPWAAIATLPSAPAIVLPVDPADDDDLERGLGMLGGQLAMARLRMPHLLRQLRDDACTPVGFATFDPALPGARIFRVAHPAFAAPLLAALRPLATSASDEVALVVDDHEALAELLCTHGAAVRLRLLHYSGPLPLSA